MESSPPAHLSTPTITRGQSLRPYPQFTDVNSALATYGSSSYNALFVTLQRRLANGFSVSAAYTWSKLIDNVIPSPNWGGFSGSSFQIGLPQNYWNPKSERSVVWLRHTTDARSVVHLSAPRWQG